MHFDLVNSLIAHFNAQVVLTCIGDTDTDMAGLPLSELEVFQQHVKDTCDPIFEIILQSSFPTLVICPGANLSHLDLDKKLFGKDHVWLFWADDETGPKLDSLPLSSSSNFLVGTELPDGGAVLREYYAVKSQRKSALFGLWSPADGLVVEGPTWERRRDLSEVTVVVTVKKFDMVLIRKSEFELSGWLGRMIHYIQKELNFRFVLRLNPFKYE